MRSAKSQSVYETLLAAGDFGAEIRRVVWQGQPDFRKAQDLLVLLTELRGRRLKTEALQILAAAMDPLSPSFLAELNAKVVGDQREQMTEFMRLRSKP